MIAPCPSCPAGDRLPCGIASLFLCAACGGETFRIDMERGGAWSHFVPGDVVEAARGGDVARILPLLVDDALAVPVNDARPWGELCRSHHADLGAWARALSALEGPRNDHVFGLLVRGVALLGREELHRRDLGPAAFVDQVDSPEPGLEPYGASVDAVGRSLLVAPRRHVFLWAPGEKPRAVWRGDSILEPLGGGFWGTSSPHGGPLYRAGADGSFDEWTDRPPNCRALVQRLEDGVVLRWRPTAGGVGRSQLLPGDGSPGFSTAGQGGELWPVPGGWLSVEERDDRGDVVPLTARDADGALLWRSPDRWPAGGQESWLLSLGADEVELLGPDRRCVERRRTSDGALIADPQERATSPALPGGWCRSAQGTVEFVGAHATPWSLEARVEWIGSARLFLAVGGGQVQVVDAFSGQRWAPLAVLEPEERVLGCAAFGGVVLSNGAHAAFVAPDRPVPPWSSLPFAAHPMTMTFGPHLVFVDGSNQPRAVVAAVREGVLELLGVVDNARPARGITGHRHWLTGSGVGPIFLSEERWTAFARP